MTPDEFSYQLAKLPSDTPLTAAHVAALFAALTPKSPTALNLDELPSSKLIDEAALADWLSESPSTLQKWRVKGGGPAFVKNPKSVRYAVGAVRDWIATRTVRSTSEATALSINRFDAFSVAATGSVLGYPVMVRGGLYEGFFRSIVLSTELVPEAFRVLRFPAFKNVFNAPENLAVADSYVHDQDVLLAEFLHLVRKDIGKASEMFRGVGGPMAQSVRIAYFACALPYAPSLAEEIITAQSSEISLSQFDVARWLWETLVVEDMIQCQAHLANAFEVLEAQGADLNKATQILDVAGQKVFCGTIAHLLADETGRMFNVGLEGMTEISATRLFGKVLDLGLDIDKPIGGDDDRTARSIAFADDRGATAGLLRRAIESRDLHARLSGLLSPKVGRSP